MVFSFVKSKSFLLTFLKWNNFIHFDLNLLGWTDCQKFSLKISSYHTHFNNIYYFCLCLYNETCFTRNKRQKHDGDMMMIFDTSPILNLVTFFSPFLLMSAKSIFKIITWFSFLIPTRTNVKLSHQSNEAHSLRIYKI